MSGDMLTLKDTVGVNKAPAQARDPASPSAIVDALKGGLTQTEVARQFDMPISQVHVIAKQNNIGRKTKLSEADQEEIITMVTHGMTMQAVGKHFGVSRERIRQIAKKHGLEPRSEALNREKELVILAFEEGLSDDQIATKLKVDTGFVRRTRLGIGLHRHDVIAKSMEAAIERVRNGESIRKVAKDEGLNAERLRVFCDRAGVVSKFGRWRDYSHRVEIVQRMYGHHTWDEIATVVSEKEEKRVTGQALQTWATSQSFDLDPHSKEK
jgi:transposase-like protein